MKKLKKAVSVLFIAVWFIFMFLLLLVNLGSVWKAIIAIVVSVLFSTAVCIAVDWLIE